MNKPMMFYQFDTEKYIAEHYDFTKGYFSYKNMAFGEVYIEEDLIINNIIEYIDCNFEPTNKDLMRMNDIFPIKDSKNSERIFTEIEKLNN